MIYEKVCEFRNKLTEMLTLRGLASKSDTINTNIHVNRPQLKITQKYGWATVKKIVNVH